MCVSAHKRVTRAIQLECCSSQHGSNFYFSNDSSPLLVYHYTLLFNSFVLALIAKPLSSTANPAFYGQSAIFVLMPLLDKSGSCISLRIAYTPSTSSENLPAYFKIGTCAPQSTSQHNFQLDQHRKRPRSLDRKAAPQKTVPQAVACEIAHNSTRAPARTHRQSRAQAMPAARFD